MGWTRKLASVSGRVTRGEYLAAGLWLGALKYAVDALVFRLVVGSWWPLLDYLNPVYAQRMALAPPVQELPPWYPVGLLLWGLLFAWIGATWSARRAVDAGLSPWWCLLFLVPFVNYVLIAVLAALPTDARPRAVPGPGPPTAPARRLSLVLLAGLAYLGLLGAVLVIVTEVERSYGVATFLSLPFLFGVVVGVLANRPRLASVRATAGIALLSSVVASLALLLFALEGVVCVAMAFPIVFLGTFLGALFGRVLLQLQAARRGALLGAVLALPLAGWVDGRLPGPPAREVATSVVVGAPPEVVWRHVVAFADLPEPEGFLFSTGIAYPVRARIEGEGVGAVRRCEFSTGAFVEPITAWEEPARLAFDVAEQPVPMEEWSFYDGVRPPHLFTSFRSVRGEFRLVPLPGGRTRLEGSTWYVLDLAPEPYWRLWADAIVHRIHRRVLAHVKALAERD